MTSNLKHKPIGTITLDSAEQKTLLDASIMVEKIVRTIGLHPDDTPDVDISSVVTGECCPIDELRRVWAILDLLAGAYGSGNTYELS